MSTPKHTPGPWIVDNDVSKDTAGQPTLGIYADGPEEYGYVCGIHCGPDADITKQDYVNAHLIAAAPAMYEALHNLLNVYQESTDDNGSPVVLGAIDALAQAEGEL